MIVGDPAEFEVPERTDSSCLISGILRNLDAPFSVFLGCYAGDDVAAEADAAEVLLALMLLVPQRRC